MIPLGELSAILQRKLAGVRPGMERVVGILMAENAEMSRAMIGHEHPEWPPLAESTIAEKQALGYVGHVSATDPLLREGHLRDSLQPVVHVDGAEIIGEVGTDVPYAADQEYGTVHVPPRPFISPPFVIMEPRAVAALGELVQDALNPGKR